MPNEGGFQRFGQPDRFALDLRLLPDPDGDAAAPAASVGSWGQWRLWVRGINLTEHRLSLASGQVVRQEHVTWYLAPLLRWLAAVWTPLLHEERLPSLVRRATDARAAYLSVASTQMDNAEVFAPWQDWAARHGLRWAAEGGLVPDVFMRRLGDDIEISWGDRWQPGGEAAEYVIEPGVAHCDVADVAAALDSVLVWAVTEKALRGRPWHDAFATSMVARRRTEDEDHFLAWYLDGSEHPGQLTAAYRAAVARVGAQAESLLRGSITTHAMTILSPAVAMFGALSPQISETAAVTLLAEAAASREDANLPRRIESLVRNDPAWRSAHPWEDGYALARDLLDEMGLTESDGPTDVDDLLDRLGVVRRQVELTEDGPLGVALAGPGLAPTILTNRDHPRNRHRFGGRFTLAHELCHLLHDRDRARRVTHSSTPWAPVAVEQRANAFAAMLLMPPEAVRRAFKQRSERAGVADVVEMAQALQVGLLAAVQHLANLGQITDDDRARLLNEVIEGGAIPRMPHAAES